MKSVEEFQREQIDRLEARLEVRKVENDALRDALARKEVDLREWQHLAVELGAFAAVAKDKSRLALRGELTVDAMMLMREKDPEMLLATLLREKVLRPMVKHLPPRARQQEKP